MKRLLVHFMMKKKEESWNGRSEQLSTGIASLCRSLLCYMARLVLVNQLC